MQVKAVIVKAIGNFTKTKVYFPNNHSRHVMNHSITITQSVLDKLDLIAFTFTATELVSNGHLVMMFAFYCSCTNAIIDGKSQCTL